MARITYMKIKKLDPMEWFFNVVTVQESSHIYAESWWLTIDETSVQPCPIHWEKGFRREQKYEKQNLYSILQDSGGNAHTWNGSHSFRIKMNAILSQIEN